MAMKQYEVEQILDRVLHPDSGKPYFLIKWIGYNQEQSTWEPAENLTGCPLIMQDYLQRHPEHEKKQIRIDWGIKYPWIPKKRGRPKGLRIKNRAKNTNETMMRKLKDRYKDEDKNKEEAEKIRKRIIFFTKFQRYTEIFQEQSSQNSSFTEYILGDRYF